MFELTATNIVIAVVVSLIAAFVIKRFIAEVNPSA